MERAPARTRSSHAIPTLPAAPPPLSAEALEQLKHDYGLYARPKLMELLRIIRLDQVYVRAEGDRMAYVEDGREHEVVDFLGGFGATLLGHNHPELVKVAQQVLAARRPFVAQASVRGAAARLARRLAEVMKGLTGRDWVVTLANSGAEAIEAALKHAELECVRRVDALLRDVRERLQQVERDTREREIKFPAALAKQLETRLGLRGATGLADLPRIADAIRRYDDEALHAEPTFVALAGAFHGKTTGALKVTANPAYRAPFDRIGLRADFVEAGDRGALGALIDEYSIPYYHLEVGPARDLKLVERTHVNISALLVEAIQGEGGIRPVPRDFLKDVREIADQCGIPVIFDEIQCGLGRTGRFLASGVDGIVGDYYTFSKSLGGGLAKTSALLVDRRRYVEEFGMIHSSTFAEDEFSSALGEKALDLILADDGALLAACARKGRLLLDGLEAVRARYPDVIKEVRGEGLMLGIEFHPQARASSRCLKLLSDRHLMVFFFVGWLLHEARIRVAPTLSDNQTIRIEPSAFISEADCRDLIEAIERLCLIVQRRDLYPLLKYVVGRETPGAWGEVEDHRTEEHTRVSPRYAKKVAFIGHFIEAKDMRIWDPSLERFTDEELERIIAISHRILGPFLNDLHIIKSPTGDLVAFHMIGLCADSKAIAGAMRAKDTGWIRDSILEAVELARGWGCGAIGFGGYTSIVTNNLQALPDLGITMTTGNSFTVAMGLEAIHVAAKAQGIALGEATCAAVGAAGNICSTYVTALADEVPQLVLIGRQGSEPRLREVAGEVYFSAFKAVRDTPPSQRRGLARTIADTETVREFLTSITSLYWKGLAADKEVYVSARGRKKDPLDHMDRLGLRILEGLERELGDRQPIRIATDLSALKGANVIVSASNEPGAIIFPQHLRAGKVVICDISVPHDVHPSVGDARPDVLVVQGGVVRLPLNPHLKLAGVPLEEGHVFACMAETILIGLTGIGEHYSFGKISPFRVKKIMEIAKLHGFGLGKLKTIRSF